MRNKLLIFIFLFCWLGAGTEVLHANEHSAEQMYNAKKNRKRSSKKRSTQRTNFELTKTSGKTYVFGFAHVLGDSTAYITNINEIDSMDVQKNTKFLPFRSDFSLQLKIYLESECGLAHETATVFFSKKRSTLVKKFNKIKKRYLDSKSFVLKQIKDSDFHFVHPIDRAVIVDESKIEDGAESAGEKEKE